MNSRDIEQMLKPPDEKCPSGMDLDRLQWEELSFFKRRRIEKHLKKCDSCREQMKLRQKGFKAFADLDSHGLYQRIEMAVG